MAKNITTLTRNCLTPSKTNSPDSIKRISLLEDKLGIKTCRYSIVNDITEVVDEFVNNGQDGEDNNPPQRGVIMLKIYNTLTRTKEDFKPIRDNHVYMYSCGPTVYSYAHIGNFRTYIFMDLIRRVLKYNGYKLKGVLNITDVGHLMRDGDDGEDKMVKASAKSGKRRWEIADFYTKVFFEDLQKLNIKKPEIIAKATDHIQEMIDYVKALEEKGYAYETSDGIYFDISKFPGYGKLSGINLEDQKAGARVEVNSEKETPPTSRCGKKPNPNTLCNGPALGAWDIPAGT